MGRHKSERRRDQHEGYDHAQGGGRSARNTGAKGSGTRGQRRRHVSTHIPRAGRDGAAHRGTTRSLSAASAASNAAGGRPFERARRRSALQVATRGPDFRLTVSYTLLELRTAICREVQCSQAPVPRTSSSSARTETAAAAFQPRPPTSSECCRVRTTITTSSSPSVQLLLRPSPTASEMEITLVSGVNGNVTTISVQPTDTVNRLVQHAHSALSIPAQSQQLTHYGNALEPSTVISSTSLADGDLVMVQVKPSAPAPSMQSRATATLDMIRRDPNIMSTLRGVNPQLHQRIMNGDQSAVHDLLNMAPTMNPTNAPSPSQRLDPMSAQAQKAIEERIRQENIQDNMQAAMEHNPESFGSVIMLFVKCKINSQTDITAFVDR